MKKFNFWALAPSALAGAYLAVAPQLEQAKAAIPAQYQPYIGLAIALASALIHPQKAEGK